MKILFIRRSSFNEKNGLYHFLGGKGCQASGYLDDEGNGRASGSVPSKHRVNVQYNCGGVNYLLEQMRPHGYLAFVLAEARRAAPKTVSTAKLREKYTGFPPPEPKKTDSEIDDEDWGIR